MNPETMTFEQNMLRLEQIVRTMEKGDVPLDASLEMFREATALVASCQKQLDDAQLQVTKVLAGSDGAPQEEVFAVEAE